MLKKFFILLFITLSLFSFTGQAFAQEKNITLYLFYGDGCPHCAKEKEFLATLKSNYPDIEIKQFEVYKNSNNSKLMYETSLLLGTEVGGVPLTVIGDEYLVGFAEGITDKQIIEILSNFNQNREQYIDIVAEAKTNLFNQMKTKASVSDLKLDNQNKDNRQIEKVNLPFFGQVDPKSFSLPIITILLALVDGFNPCAMWTLLFLISLLLGMEDKKKMWILGGSFIIASAAVYFVFLAAWLNLFLFLGFVSWLRFIVSLVALGAGGYYLYDFWTNKEGACKVTGGESKNKFFTQLKKIISRKHLLSAIIGIMILAVAVNLIELVCSAGLPAVYTQILSLSGLSSLQHYGYILLYIIIFMLDDMLIFVMAMLTLQVTGVQSKYARFSHLFGGFLMLVIGVLLMFKPEWLMFSF